MTVARSYSIIVPTFNRAPSLAVTLDSIGDAIPRCPSVEIIVVDNGSTDNTLEAFKTARAHFPDRAWRYFYEPMPGLLSGRHRGAAEAKGEILSFLDDDVLLEPNWFEALQEALAYPGVALVGGPSTPVFEANPPPWLDGLWVEADGGRRLCDLSLIDCGRSIKDVDPLDVFGLNFSIRKSVFKSCHGFHPDCVPQALQRYQGDGETGLTLKIKAEGLCAIYHPDVALRHLIPGSRMTPESFALRGFFQGVCDSYTRVRSEGLYTSAESPSWKRPFRPIKRAVYRAYLLGRSDTAAIREMRARAYTNGFEFHQTEVRNDPSLLDWVLRADYFDYNLPPGWKRYLGSDFTE
jgi:glycosyltransferase involved in cell wall biosynthesis